MKTTVLVDNTPNPGNKELLAEHGLSIYFEFNKHKCLFDIGASDYFYRNAQKMGINIADVDYLIISHGHSDHTGGLQTFIDVNQKAKIFISANIKNKSFFSYRKGIKRNISTNYSIIENNITRFVFVDKNISISPDMQVVSSIPHKYPLPKGNSKLFAGDNYGEYADNFNHEIALVVNTSKGIIVFSGCSHNGILNIVSACSTQFGNKPIHACIGGTHLLDDDTEIHYELDKEIEEIAKVLIDNYPQIKLVTGHCTGSNTQKLFSKILGDNFGVFYSGFTM